MPSRLLRRIIWTVIGVFVVAGFVVGALPIIASTQIVRDRIALEMGALLGLRVTIDKTPEIEVWPTFRATLTDVKLGRWGEPDAPPVVAADRVEIELSALAALRGDVVFSRSRMTRPTLRVEKTEGGYYLPQLPGYGRLARAVDATRNMLKDNPNPDSSNLPSDEFGAVEVNDGRVITTGDDGKDQQLVTGIAGTLDWPALNRGLTTSVKGIWHGESVSVDVSSDRPLVLFAGGAGPLKFAFNSAPATASFDGTAAISEKPYIEGQAKFAAQSLRRMLEWSEVGISPGVAIGSVSVSSTISGSGKRIKLDNTEIALDGNAGVGVLELSLADVIPAISGTLAFQNLDMRSFLSTFTPQGTISESGANDPIPSLADSANLDLRLSAARANAGGITLSDVAAAAQVKGGLAVFDINDATAFGGTVQASVRFDRKPEGTQSEIRLLASDIDGGDFGKMAGMSRVFPVAKGTVSVMLKGPGRTWDSILERADGSISANFGAGLIPGLDLDGFLKRSAAGGFFSLDEVSNGDLKIDGFELKAIISNGVARIEKAQAKSGKRLLWLSGIVPYVGRGLALSGGIGPIVPPAPPPAPAPVETPPVQDQPTGEGEEGHTAETTPQPPAQPQQPSPAVVDSEPQPLPRSEASFFVGGSWNAPFISPITPITPLP